MRELIIITVAVLATVAVYAAVASVFASRIERRIRAIEKKLEERPPRPPCDEDIAAEWRRERSKYEPGSPRHTAFTNRLKELGAE